MTECITLGAPVVMVSKYREPHGCHLFEKIQTFIEFSRTEPHRITRQYQHIRFFTPQSIYEIREFFTLLPASYQVIMDVASCYNLHCPKKIANLKVILCPSIAMRKIAHLSTKLNLNLLL